MTHNELVKSEEVIKEQLTSLINEVITLKHELDLTERRALDWEQMHLEQIEINKGLRETMKTHPTTVMADRMERLTRLDWEQRREDFEKEEKKRDAHNAAMRENVEKQTKIMDANMILHARDVTRSEESLELIRRSVIASEKQTEIFSKMLPILDHIAGKIR